MSEPKHQRWLTDSEIQAICQALTQHKHMLLDHDLTYGSTYFTIMASQRERAFDHLIDRIKNGEIVKGVVADNSSCKDNNVTISKDAVIEVKYIKTDNNSE